MKQEDRFRGVLDASRLTDHGGIFISSAIAGPTVWDALADEAPVHAAISAGDEQSESEKSAQQIEEIAGLVSDTTVLLDVGCGYGRIAKYLLPRKRLAGYVGVDSALTMLRLFKARHDSSQQESATPVAFVNSDIADLPLLSGSIDLAVVSAVFLHNHKSIVGITVKEIERVLKPGGRLLVYSSFPRRATMMGLQGSAYQALLNLRGTPTRNGPVRYYSKREVRNMLAGFSDVELRPVGFEVAPKSIIGLRGAPERAFRLGFSGPFNRGLEKILPNKWRAAFARHYDVRATK